MLLLLIICWLYLINCKIWITNLNSIHFCRHYIYMTNDIQTTFTIFLVKDNGNVFQSSIKCSIHFKICFLNALKLQWMWIFYSIDNIWRDIKDKKYKNYSYTLQHAKQQQWRAISDMQTEKEMQNTKQKTSKLKYINYINACLCDVTLSVYPHSE